MAIQWGWLQPLVTAPYVTTLGPVHPQAVTAGLFADLIEVAETGCLLPYDKDRRWADSKDEQVLPTAIIQESSLVMIPTQMRTFSPTQPDAGSEAPAGAVPLDEVPEAVRVTFSVFAGKLAAEGFAFLDARIRRGGTGPVLTVQRDSTIVGAIGPMEIMPDSRGAPRLLPQYFGVLPEYRGHGLGRSLWRAAMHWGQQHRAAYQLLQTQVGGASDRLCQSEGLTDLGLVCTVVL